MLVAGGTDLLPEHEAAAADAEGRRRPARASRRCARLRDRRRRRRRSAPASRSPSSSATGACARDYPASRRRSREIATPHLRNMGTLGGNLLPRHALQLLRPELRVAPGDRLLHEEGRRHLLGGDRRARSAWPCRRPTPRRCCIALGARVRLVSAGGERWVAVADLYENDGIHYLTRRARRDPDATIAVPARDGLAQHLLEAAPPRRVRLPGAVGGGGGARRRGRHGADGARRARRRGVAADGRRRRPRRRWSAGTLDRRRDRRRRRRRLRGRPSRWTTPTSTWCGASG